MAFDRQFLDELIARNDIVDVVSNYVSLQPRGRESVGLLPLSQRKTPSFHVLPDKQLCYCFGCKKGGGVINFIMEEENLSFPDAVRFLARRANMPVPEEEHSDESRLRSRILSLNRDAARFYYDQLYSPKGAPGARVYEKPQDHAAQCNELRPRRIGGRVGRLTDRDAEKGLWRRRAACLGSCHPRQKRRAVRQIPQAPHLPHHRRARRCAGLWRAHHQQGRSWREIHEHARDHRLQQAARFIRAEPGQKEQAQQHYFGRGQHRRRDAASGGIRQCLRLDGHSADDGASCNYSVATRRRSCSATTTTTRARSRRRRR